MFESSDLSGNARRPDLELQILRDLQDKTGYQYPSLSGISVDDPAVAAKVLEVLASWVGIIHESNYRSFIYLLFGKSRCARAWFDEMLRWWKLETDPIAKGQLSMLIAHHTTDEDGRRVWELTKNAQFNGQSFVFARLAAISEVREEVVDRILNDLKQGRYELGDLLVYSKLTDASIRKWLIEEGGRSSDRRVRELSRRLTEKTRQPPAWIRRAHVPPSRDAEVWSTEVDVSALDQALARAAGQLGIPLRKVGRARTFLAFVDSDEWFVGQLGVRGEERLDLWLRAEDRDTVEIVITKGSR